MLSKDEVYRRLAHYLTDMFEVPEEMAMAIEDFTQGLT